jgi:hypothetical protein
MKLVFQGLMREAVLFLRKVRTDVGSCPAEMDGRDQLMAGWAGFWPRQATRAGLLGGLPVGFWAADPGGRVETVVGRFSPRSVMNSDICDLFWWISEAILLLI